MLPAKSTSKELRSKILLNLTNLENQIFLNNAIELVRSRIEQLNQLNLNFLSLDKLSELDDNLKSISNQFSDLLKKIIELNEELDEKEEQAQVINESIIDLPDQFNKTIKEFQNDESISRLANQFNKLTDEIKNCEIRQIINEDLIKEAREDETFIESRKKCLNKEVDDLNSELAILIASLHASKRTYDRQAAESTKIELVHDRAQSNLSNLNNELLKMQKDGEMMMRQLNEKLDLSTKLKEKRQHLLNGTYMDDKTKELKTKIGQKKNELKQRLDQIDDVKSKTSTQSRSTYSIKQILLKDNNLNKEIRAFVTKLNELIDINYKDQYLLFDDGYSQL